MLAPKAAYAYQHAMYELLLCVLLLSIEETCINSFYFLFRLLGNVICRDVSTAINTTVKNVSVMPTRANRRGSTSLFSLL